MTTHDLPPTAGYLTGEHVELRAELGLLERPVDEERATDEAERIAWLRALEDAGLLAAGVPAAVALPAEPGSVAPRRDNFRTRVEPHVSDIVEALHAYLGSTPARLIGIYLPDVVGDRRPVNQPGTIDEYPNWRVPMTNEKERPVLLEELMASPVARRLASLVRARWANPPCDRARPIRYGDRCECSQATCFSACRVGVECLGCCDRVGARWPPAPRWPSASAAHPATR